MYIFKNMTRLSSKPETFREKIFDRLNGISTDLIAKCTGLALEDVLALQS